MVSSCFSEKWCSFPSFPTDFPQKWRTMARARNTCPPMIWALWWPPWRAAPTRWPCTSMVAASFRGAMVKWTGDEPGKTFFFFFHILTLYDMREIWNYTMAHWMAYSCVCHGNPFQMEIEDTIPPTDSLTLGKPPFICRLGTSLPSRVYLTWGDSARIQRVSSIIFQGIRRVLGRWLGLAGHTWGTLLLWNWLAGPSHVATTFMRHLIIAKFESHKVLMLCSGAFEMCSMGQWTKSWAHTTRSFWLGSACEPWFANGGREAKSIRSSVQWDEQDE